MEATHELNLTDVYIFYRVVRADGVNAAAKDLNMGRASVWRAIWRIERTLGKKIWKPTPPSNKGDLTEDGRILFQAIAEGFDGLVGALRIVDAEPSCRRAKARGWPVKKPEVAS